MYNFLKHLFFSIFSHFFKIFQGTSIFYHTFRKKKFQKKLNNFFPNRLLDMFGQLKTYCVCVSPFFFFGSAFQHFREIPVGLVHYSRDPQTHFFNKIFIKNKSHGTIHIFKNYFTIVFSIFSKISIIQTDP